MFCMVLFSRLPSFSRQDNLTVQSKIDGNYCCWLKFELVLLVYQVYLSKGAFDFISGYTLVCEILYSHVFFGGVGG